MSVCAVDSGLVGAAVFAAPEFARDTVHRQRRGVNDPGRAPREPPRRRPRGRSRPAVFVSESRARWRGNVPRSGAPSPRKCAAHSDVDYAVDSMVVLRCTQRLVARLKRPEAPANVPSTTRLGDWYGNILQVGRRQHLLSISERSRLPVVIPIREANPSRPSFWTQCVTYLAPSVSVRTTSPMNVRECQRSRSGGRTIVVCWER